EVNMGAGIPANEALQIVGLPPPNTPGRGLRQPRSYTTMVPAPAGLPTRRFDLYSNDVAPNFPLQNNSAIAWGSTIVPMPTAPFGNSITGAPFYDLTKFQTQNTAEPFHPSLFNPNDWPSTTLLANRTYQLSDAKRLIDRYANTPAS